MTINLKDKATLWAMLWDQHCPPDLRHFETCSKLHGGELRFAWESHRRKFSFDWCIPELKIAVEIDGAVYGRKVKCNHCGRFVQRFTGKKWVQVYAQAGRHTRGTGFTKDQEKRNLSTELGWYVLSYTTQTLNKSPGECIDQVVRVVRSRL